MNEGTSAKEALLGQQVKLGLGFIAVRIRTQKELNVEKFDYKSLMREKLIISVLIQSIRE